MNTKQTLGLCTVLLFALFAAVSQAKPPKAVFNVRQDVDSMDVLADVDADEEEYVDDEDADEADELADELEFDWAHAARASAATTIAMAASMRSFLVFT